MTPPEGSAWPGGNFWGILGVCWHVKNSGVGVSFSFEVLDGPQGGVMRIHLKFTRPGL